jgi:hypothetical protein
MAQLPIRGFQPVSTDRDDFLQSSHLIFDQPFVFPFATERGSTLQHFDRFGGFAQHEQSVRVTESRDHLGPVIVRVGRANDHLYIGIRLPQMFNCLQSIPARRHPHVDECHRVRTPRGDRLGRHLYAFLPLVRRVDLEVRPNRQGNGRAEQVRFEQIQGCLRGLICLDAQDLAEVMVNGCVVIDDEDAAAQGIRLMHGECPGACRAVRGRMRRRVLIRRFPHARYLPVPERQVRRCAIRSHAPTAGS